jgi:hypothetical protein
MTAPVLVGVAQATGNSASYNLSLTSLTGGIDTQPSQNDLVIVVNGAYGTSDISMGVSTSGFTKEAEGYSDDTRDTNAAFSWKIMTGTPDTVVSCDGSGNAANGAAAVCQVWRGVDTTTPFDVALVHGGGIDEARVNTGAITPVTTDAIVGSCGIGVSAAVQGTLSAPTGYNLGFIQGGVDPGIACVALIAAKAWGGGTENAAVFGGTWTTSSSDSWYGFAFALRPAAGGSGIGASTGISTVTAVGISTVTAVGSSIGTSAVTGVSNALLPTVGSGAGTCTVAAVGNANVQGVGNGVGTSTAAAISTAVGSTANAAGTCTVSAVGLATKIAIGGSSCTSSVIGISSAPPAPTHYVTGTVITYTPETPPDDLVSLVTYIKRELDKVSHAIDFGLARNIEFLTVEPTKPREGMLRGADGTYWNPGYGKGLYGYFGGVWVKLG